MTEVMKCLYAIALLLTCTASLWGRTYVGNEPCPPTMGAAEAADPCASCAQIWPSRGPNWIITPHGGPCVACGMDIYVTVDFLYWTAREDHLVFANKENFSSQGRRVEPDWCFGPGFKIGFGHLYNHDGWDIYGEYTSFCQETKSRSVRAKGDQQLSIVPFYDIDTPEKIKAQWKLDFSRVDLSLGRNFFISRYLMLKPFIGLIGTWQKQSFPITTTPADPADQSYHFTNRMDYWGIGIRWGIDTSWHVNKAVSFVGNFSLSGVWQGFDVDTKIELEPSGSIASHLGNHFHAINPVIELLLGIRWETWFCCDRYHFSIEGGWEIQWWENQNHFDCFSCGDRLGALYLQGLTARIRLDF